VGCVTPIAAYATWFHAVNGQYALTRSTGFFLWGRVSSFADCTKIRPPPPELPLCISQPVADRAPPGRFIWSSRIPRSLPGGPVAPRSNKLMRDFAIRAVIAQPFGYLGTIAKDAGLAVYWRRLDYPSAFSVQQTRFPYKPQVLPANRSWIPGGIPPEDARAYGRADPSRVVRPFSAAVRVYQRFFYTYGPLLGAALLFAFGGLIRFWRRLGVPVLLPLAVFMTLLLFPIATADFSYRYLHSVVPFAFLAAALAFAPGEENTL
jgi:hypothetical protein